MKERSDTDPHGVKRRDVIKSLFALAATYTATGCQRDADSLSTFFHTHFKRMSPEKLADTLASWERR